MGIVERFSLAQQIRTFRKGANQRQVVAIQLLEIVGPIPGPSRGQGQVVQNPGEVVEPGLTTIGSALTLGRRNDTAGPIRDDSHVSVKPTINDFMLPSCHHREFGGQSRWRANSQVSTIGIGDPIVPRMEGCEIAWNLRKKKKERAPVAVESAHEAAI